MKKTVIISAICLIASPVFADRDRTPPRSELVLNTEFEAINNSGLAQINDGSGSIVNGGISNDRLTANRNISVSPPDSTITNRALGQRDISNIVLNVQANSGNQQASVGTSNVEVALEQGASGDHNGASLSATALGNSFSVEMAGSDSSLENDGQYSHQHVDMDSHSLGLNVSNTQANSGNQLASITANSSIDIEIDQGYSGSFNSVSTAATAVGNMASIKIGGIVD